MDNKEFKVLFGKIALEHGFIRAFGGWYKQSDECIAILELQKSNYADYYYLNGKILVQGLFDRSYAVNKEQVKSPSAHIGFNETPEFRPIFNFDEQMDDSKRTEELEKLFNIHIIPFTNKGLSKKGILELINYDKVPILSVVKEELKKLIDDKGKTNEVNY